MESRLAFVTNEYRTLDRDDPSIRSKSQNARIITLTTYLDEAGAGRRATEELRALGRTRVFELVIEMIVLPDDFKDGPPRCAIYSPADGLNGEQFSMFEVASVSLTLGTSTVRVR